MSEEQLMNNENLSLPFHFKSTKLKLEAKVTKSRLLHT